MRSSNHIANQPRRRVFIWLACALWVLSFEALPNFHIGFHSLLAPHHHHGDNTSAHSDDEERKESPEHGAESMEHRGVATLDAPAMPAIHAPTTYQIFTHCDSSTAFSPSTRPQKIRSRGPPLLS